MIDYIIHFYLNYKIIFYLLLIIWVIIEGPIIILSLCLLAPKFGFGFFEILFFAFLWDFIWDLFHFLFARFFRNKFKNKDFWIIKNLEKKLRKHSLLDKLIIIKYTPPITSLWLLYLWFSNTSFKKYLKNSIYLSVFTSLFITFIWYNFGYLFSKQDNFYYFIILLFLSFVLFYFLFKLLRKYLLKKIYDS